VNARRAVWGPAVAVATALAVGAAAGAVSAPREHPAGGTRAGAALLERLRAAGRVEARLEGRAWGLGDGPPVRARLALEPPDRTSLDVEGTGERITARRDGGEWLQPAHRQMLRLGPGRVAPMLSWWSLLLGAGDGLVERPLGGRRYLLVPRAPAGVDSAWVTLGRDGLPARLETVNGDARAAWRLSGWRFGPARGRAAFVLEAPRGVEVVPLD
jgi:hypothetical protein